MNIGVLRCASPPSPTASTPVPLRQFLATLTDEDIAALVAAFKYRTGVDLLSAPGETAAKAWAAYKARQHKWIGKPRKLRRFYPEKAA